MVQRTLEDMRRLEAVREGRRRGLFSTRQKAALAELERRFASVVEPAMTMATGAIAEPVSGFMGLAALPFGSDTAANVVRNVQEGMTYQPRSEGGQEGMRALGGLMDLVGGEADQASNVLMQNFGIDPRSPEGYAVRELLPTVAGAGPAMAGARAIPGTQYELGDVDTSGPQGSQRGIFAGIRARNAPLEDLDRAKALEESGVPREEIWSETGWFKGADGEWRFEIDDSQTSFYEGEQTKEMLENALAIRKSNLEKLKQMQVEALESGDRKRSQEIAGAISDQENNIRVIEGELSGERGSFFVQGGLQDFLKNSPAFDKYPKESQIAVLSDDMSATGLYNPETQSMEIGTEGEGIESPRAIALHELQHAIQEAENFATGGIPEDVGGYDAYRNLAGEAEARLVQQRMDYTPKQRRQRPPWMDLDVPEDELIVRRSGE